MTLPVPTGEEEQSLPIEPEDPHARWTFFRDVLVFQVKLVLGNLHNFVFVPISLAAAGVDLLFRSGRQGARFYRVMEWARHVDEAIGLYSALGEGENGKKYSVDAVVARIEDVIVREYAKGGTAASVKTAVDKALDKMQRDTPAHLDPEEIVKRAAEKIRSKMQKDNAAPPQAPSNP
jgi:hypothetical protein